MTRPDQQPPTDIEETSASVSTFPCPCGGTCACHGHGAFPPPCDVAGGCGSTSASTTEAPAKATQPQRCAIGSTEHPVEHEMRVCRRHRAELERLLREVEDETAILSAAPSMAIRYDTGGGGLASETAPARLNVIAMTDRRRGHLRWGASDFDEWGLDDTPSVLEVLTTWAYLVRSERDLTHPQQKTVTSERETLTRHLDWITDQPWVDELHRELRGLVGQLKQANLTASERRRYVGLCPTLLDEGECGGKLWPDKRNNAVYCGSCGRIFGRDELRHLGDMLIRQGHVEIFRAEWFTGVPASTIRRWVSEGSLTVQRDGRKVLVRITEIEALQTGNKRTRARLLDGTQ